MTAVKCESKGFGIGDTSCRVCNYFAEYENLRHLLLDCKALQIVDARLFLMFVMRLSNMALFLVQIAFNVP